ncbi:MAG: hypothetical protein JNL18_03725 [Planctomycetaceae bacterium]|nr:hypothetical protein [Planctomycetaceae bacterium]
MLDVGDLDACRWVCLLALLLESLPDGLGKTKTPLGTFPSGVRVVLANQGAWASGPRDCVVHVATAFGLLVTMFVDTELGG